MMDKVEAARVFKTRSCDTRNLQWMAEVAAKMMVTTRNDGGGNELERNIDREYIEDIYKGAKEVFCNGIYVKSGQHPCGWDFVGFDDLECSEDMFSMQIECDAISGGCYHYSELEGLTVEEIVKKVGTKGWCFELSGVDDLE